MEELSRGWHREAQDCLAFLLGTVFIFAESAIIMMNKGTVTFKRIFLKTDIIRTMMKVGLRRRWRSLKEEVMEREKN